MKESWRAIVGAGLISGLVFLVIEMLAVPIFLGMSMWAPPRMMAAIVMGEGVLPPPDTFDPVILLVAMLVHFPLSILFTVPLAWLVRRMNLAPALAVGAVYGIVLYLINFYLMTAFFPWFAMARNWVSVASHIVFGIVAAGAFSALRRPETGVAGA